MRLVRHDPAALIIRRSVARAFVLSALLSATGSAFASAPVVRGAIRFADGEVPIYAFVSLTGGNFSQTVDADPAGNYSFSDVPSGTYKLLAFGSGPEHQAGAATVRDLHLTAETAEPVVVDLQLLTDPTAIREQ